MLKPIPDPELADPCRLAIAIAVAVASGGGIRFGDLGRGLGLSEGNLASHLRRLAHAGLLEVRSNGARGRASRTEYALTASGRTRLAAVGEAMQTAAHAIEAALTQPSPRKARADVSQTHGSFGEAAAGVAAEVRPSDVGPSLVDERFSGPD